MCVSFVQIFLKPVLDEFRAAGAGQFKHFSASLVDGHAALQGRGIGTSASPTASPAALRFISARLRAA